MAPPLRTISTAWTSQKNIAQVRRAHRCLDVIQTLGRHTARALMDRLTDQEFEALCGPALCQYLDTLSEADLSALATGNPAVTRQVQQWIRTGHHQGDIAR